VRETLARNDIYGSLHRESFYEDDALSDVIAWLSGLLAEVPENLRGTAKVNVESVGGYEGEHHAEIHVYYDRPETDEEMDARIFREGREKAASELHERRLLEALKRKYEKGPS